MGQDNIRWGKSPTLWELRKDTIGKATYTARVIVDAAHAFEQAQNTAKEPYTTGKEPCNLRKNTKQWKKNPKTWKNSNTK